MTSPAPSGPSGPDTAADAMAVRNRNRNRTALLVVLVMFFGGFLIAGALRFSGWRPAGMKNHGELLDPAADLRGLAPQLLDGGDYAWNPVERTWRIVVPATAGCGAPCGELATEIELVRELFTKDADRVHVLWIGDYPVDGPRTPALRLLQDAPELRAALPRSADPAGVPVYVVDPNGFVVLRYAPGFDPGHLRTDLSRLLKLK